MLSISLSLYMYIYIYIYIYIGKPVSQAVLPRPVPSARLPAAALSHPDVIII